MAINTDDRSLGQMFGDLSRDTRTLIQQEIELAKTELSGKISRITKSAGLIIVGGLVAYAGLLAMVAALVLGLITLGLPPWAGALLGGVLITGIGFVLFRAGLAALPPAGLTPKHTIETLKEDAQWIKSQAR